MISFPSEEEISELRAFHKPHCVTIYLPFIEPNTATNPNQIDLKNLLREAETELTAAGVSATDIRKTLEPAHLLLESAEFWPIYHEGLALFLHPRLFRYYRLPDHSMSRLVTTAERFNLAPLLETMKNNRSYYLLTLGHKNVRLYEGDHFRLEPVRLKGFPADMKTALNIDEYPKSLETHSIAPAGKGSEAFHEQYNVAETDKAMLLEFFRWIDRRLHQLLIKHPKPLVLAGVGYLLPMYRKVNTYPELLEGAISGNQDEAEVAKLREQAWNLVVEADSS